MLYEIMKTVNNFFISEENTGSFEIVNGELVSPFTIQKDQYYIIEGSVFNDGLFRRGDEEEPLRDEAFTGTVYLLSIPRSFMRLVSDIQNYQKEYGEKMLSPYQSESFGGYSYTKAAGSSAADATSWKTAFASQLSNWRKI